MTRIFSSCRHAPGVAVIAAVGFALAACAGPMTDGSARYAENVSPRVMSDAMPMHHAAEGLRGDSCVPDTQTFAADCGGFVRYDGP